MYAYNSPESGLDPFPAPPVEGKLRGDFEMGLMCPKVAMIWAKWWKYVILEGLSHHKVVIRTCLGAF